MTEQNVADAVVADPTDTINREQFAQFVHTIVESLARIQEIVVNGIVEQGEDQIVFTSESIVLSQEATEYLANQMLAVAGLPPLNVIDQPEESV